ncbi:hypothetical protein AYL99_03215 [Fonsecaea erecta]|uniref:Uncharacterized protein n=1 Tax=Fonsecaea erecta TaxID=1367422 RepID=A0A178ZW16_9EURO|nr:hypothetical protein AYL99_03215 [Fonsecaea erecta]OAP63988.1 hypothetical protein AYL99_03215 [Fonsecaea erecta]
MPTIFTNEYSRGPLYQYWKERNQEEKALREQRIEEAKLRSKGFRPMGPAFGPSSTDSYAHRATSGPPAYRHDADAGAEEGAVEGSLARPGRQGSAGQDDPLPSYGASTGQSDTAADASLFSAEEEKSRLRHLEEQRQQIQSDAALAQTLSAQEESEEDQEQAGSKGKQPARRKSTAGKIGRWLADAATGYTRKQERW